MKVIYDITILATGSGTRVKSRNCQGTYHQSGDNYTFELEQTKRWFDLSSFTPKPGYLLILEGSDHAFEITNVDYKKTRPKHAIFTAIPVTQIQKIVTEHAAS